MRIVGGLMEGQMEGWIDGDRDGDKNYMNIEKYHASIVFSIDIGINCYL